MISPPPPLYPEALAGVDRLRAQKTAEDFIKAQKMLSFAVRHNFSASTKSDAAVLPGRAPISLKEFAEDSRGAWL